MDALDFDIVIIGAGLSGLSLATRFCAPQFAHLRVAIIDPRTTFGATHTWSFWAQTPHAFMDCVATNKQWRQLLVRAAGGEAVLQDCAKTPYCSIESTQFYARCLKIMAGNARITAFFGHHVDDIDVNINGGANVVFKNTAGITQTIHATWVFDSRPPTQSRPLNPKAWLQVFAGGEVTATAPHFAAMFERGEAVLMDFVANPLHPEIPTFIYLLPSSPTQALVQATAFVPPGAKAPSDAALQALALEYLQARYTGFALSAQQFESGCIVMDAAILATTKLEAITKIGAAGGFVRAATGYSFTRTQRACDALEKAVMSHAGTLIGSRAFPSNTKAINLPIYIHWQSRLVPLLDTVFLEAIATPHFDVGRLMARLFQRVPPARLVRFLDGNMTVADALVVVLACPKWVFMRSFFSCAWRYVKLIVSRGAF